MDYCIAITQSTAKSIHNIAAHSYFVLNEDNIYKQAKLVEKRQQPGVLVITNTLI